MSQVQDIYKESEFEVLLNEARINAANDWEETFVSDLADKFGRFGQRMYLSEAQQQQLERIANDN